LERKGKLRVAVVVVVVVVGVWVSVAQGGSFNADRVHFIDRTPPESGLQNSFFRGNEPLLNGVFCYDELVQRMREIAILEGNFTLPESFFLIDLSLLDLEVRDQRAELVFFDENPSLGKVVRKPTVGNPIPANSFPEYIRKQMAEDLSFDLDDLIERTEELHAMLNQQYDSPVVIYIHCEAGVDRTGEMSGAYYLRWFNWSWKQTIDYDYSVEGRNIAYLSQLALNWYCYHLQYWVEGYDYLDCTTYRIDDDSTEIVY